MVTAVDVHYQVASGGAAAFGRFVLPAWRQGKAVDEWFPIAGTSGAGGAAVNAYSGMAYRSDTGDLLTAAAGGHAATFDNRVVACRLNDAAPAWRTLRAASTVTQPDVPHYLDNTPASRHTYASQSWCASRGRLMLHGCYGVNPSGNSFRTVDGFDPATGEWDAPGTYQDMPSTMSFYTTYADPSGDKWGNASGGFARWNHATDTYTAFAGVQSFRFPGAFDTLRNFGFLLQHRDGQSSGGTPTWTASKISLAGVQSIVTFAPSAARDQLFALTPAYCGMDYDQVKDEFLFMPGNYGTPNGLAFVIKPNSGTVWDVSVKAYGAGNIAPGPFIDAGIVNRLLYIPAQRGFVLLPQASSNLFFLPTAA